MSDRWNPENILNLFLKAPHESPPFPNAPEVFSRLYQQDELHDPEGVKSAEKAISDYLLAYAPLTTEPQEQAIVSPLRKALRRSASVLTAFDPYQLQPLGIEAESCEVMKELIDDIVEVYDPPTKKQRWMLQPTIREEVLREFGTKDDLTAALNANPERPATLVQRILESYINGAAQPIFDLLPLELLATHLQAVRWLAPTNLELPSPEVVQAAIDQREVPAVFAKMAGQNFVGREEELALLSDHVEVLDPSSKVRSVERQVRKWFGLQTKPPLVIYGAGGVGKTTLISKFLLLHMEVADEFKFPYVYLDFDNPRLSVDDPNTILAEASRQLSIQYPSARPEFDGFLGAEQERSVHQDFDGSDAILDFSGRAQEVQAADSLSRFAELVKTIIHRKSKLGDYSLPLLIVLDTYEEVQYRGLKSEIQLWNLMDSIQKGFPSLRVVVFGRAPLQEVPTTSTRTTVHALSDFDQSSAEAFLRKLKINDPDVAGELFDSVGGNPLSLKLAAEVYHREGRKTQLVKKGWLRSLFFFSASELLIQGQLYQRILNHIHDQDVRKIAHPGLVLRRITWELIKEVLAKPCGIVVPDEKRARELFDALAREVALVTKVSPDVLAHRADLRRKMLQFIERDKPAEAEQIHRLAADYYAKSEGLAARAEEIYHLLKLKAGAQVIESRWLPGVETLLREAIDELPVESKPILASYLGIRLNADDVKAAGIAEWERYTARSAGELIKLGRYERALKELKTRRGRTKGSPLHLIEARALASLGRWKEAANVVEQGLTAASISGNRQEMLESVFLAARISQEAKDTRRADEYLQQAANIAAALDDRVKQILAVLHRIRLRLGQPSKSKAESAELLDQLATLLATLPESDWLANKKLVRASVSLLGADRSDFVISMLRRIGLGELDKTQSSTFTRALQQVHRQSPAVRQLTDDFLKTLRLSSDLSLSATVSALQKNNRLDEFVEDLIPLMLKERELAEPMWHALASLYSNTNLENEES